MAYPRSHPKRVTQADGLKKNNENYSFIKRRQLHRSNCRLTLDQLTLTVSTRIALPAAFLIHHRSLAAFGAQVADLHGLEDGFFRLLLDLVLHTVAVLLPLHRGQGAGFPPQVQVEHLPDAVRQGATVASQLVRTSYACSISSGDL